MLIRHLTSADLPALADFYASLTEAVTYYFQPWPEVTEEVLREHLVGGHAGRHLVLGLVAPEGTVEVHGCVCFVDSDQPLLGIGLRERAQGQGWGRALLEALLAEADARSLPEVHVTVLKDNARARNLYESVDFLIVGEKAFRCENDSLCLVRRRVW